MVSTKFRLIIFFVVEDGEALYSQQKQDWELTMAQIILLAKFRFKLKKVGTTTRSLRSDLNQTPYDMLICGILKSESIYKTEIESHM